MSSHQNSRSQMDTASKVFTHGAIISVTILQKFGLIIGSSSTLFLCLPLFFALVGWAYWKGYAQIRKIPLSGYCILLASMLTATVAALIYPDNRFGSSLTSLFGIVITYCVFLVGPSQRFARGYVLPTLLLYGRFICMIAITQYFIQFLGIKIFSFERMIPGLKPILVERAFAIDPVLEYGSSILRANGLFILEPSILSQLVVILGVTDFFVFKRVIWAPLYAVAYLVTFSGTGALCLILAIMIYACLDWSRIAQTVGFIAGVAVCLVVGSALFPEQFARIADRGNELQSEGSSGYARYTSQLGTIATVINEPRSVIGFGPGATTRSPFYVEGSGSSQMQLLIDYGIFGLVSFFTFFGISVWRRNMLALSVLSFTIYVVGGGYLLFSPMIILIAMICIWSEVPERAAAGPSAHRQALHEQRLLRPTLRR
jgi:hypothetical protein